MEKTLVLQFHKNFWNKHFSTEIEVFKNPRKHNLEKMSQYWKKWLFFYIGVDVSNLF